MGVYVYILRSVQRIQFPNIMPASDSKSTKAPKQQGIVIFASQSNHISSVLYYIFLLSSHARWRSPNSFHNVNAFIHKTHSSNDWKRSFLISLIITAHSPVYVNYFAGVFVLLLSKRVCFSRSPYNSIQLTHHTSPEAVRKRNLTFSKAERWSPISFTGVIFGVFVNLHLIVRR